LRKLLLWVGVGCGIVVMITAQYDNNGGILRFGHPPFLQISLAPTREWIVQNGVNYVPDRGLGVAGNALELPVWPGYRVGIRFFSPRWWKEEQAK